MKIFSKKVLTFSFSCSKQYFTPVNGYHDEDVRKSFLLLFLLLYRHGLPIRLGLKTG